MALVAGADADNADGEDERPLVATARQVVAAAGLGNALSSPKRLPFSPAQLRGMALSPLLQGAALAAVAGEAWCEQSDATLLAQGHASGSAAVLFARFVLPQLPDLAERLSRPGARMLDVGTGIGAMAVGYAEAFPHLHVTGIDVMPRVLQLARARLQASPVAARVELRQQDVTELDENASYDLAWIPAPFVPEHAFRTGIARMVTALRPGGLLIIGHGRFDGNDLQNAITRFKTTAYGGTAIDGPAAIKLLEQLRLSAVQTAPTPPGAPSLTMGRK